MSEYSDEKRKEIADKVKEWIAEFSKSEHFNELTYGQKHESGFIIDTFTELMYSYHGLTPEEWDEDGVEECCLYTLPRKIATDIFYYKSLATVLSVFFAFLSEKNILKNAPKLIRRLRKIDKQIVRNAQDPNNWGMGKSLVMSARNAGVDITNKTEMDSFINIYNKQLAKKQKGTSK